MIWGLLAIELVVLLVHGPRAWRRRFWNMLIALDQLGNAWLGGDPDETISSRASKRLHKTGWRLLGRFLDTIDPGHMKRAREDDEGGDAAWK